MQTKPGTSTKNWILRSATSCSNGSLRMNRQKGRAMSQGKWFSVPWYFLAFSAYPVLALMAVNVGQVKAGAVWRPLLVSILFAVLLWALIKLALRDPYRVAFLTALWLALFFSYGHIHIMLTEKWDE